MYQVTWSNIQNIADFKLKPLYFKIGPSYSTFLIKLTMSSWITHLIQLITNFSNVCMSSNLVRYSKIADFKPKTSLFQNITYLLSIFDQTNFTIARIVFFMTRNKKFQKFRYQIM